MQLFVLFGQRKEGYKSQFGVDQCKTENIDLSFIKATRVQEVIDKFNDKVKDWAQKYKP